MIIFVIDWLVVKHQVCDISSIVMTRISLKIINRTDKRWSRNGSMSGCFRSIYFIVKTNGSDTICFQLNIVFTKVCIMLYIAHLYKFTYIILLKLWVRIPLMAMCIRQDIMWYSLSLTCDRSTVYSGYSGILHSNHNLLFFLFYVQVLEYSKLLFLLF